MDHKVDLPLSLRTWCDPAVGARLSNRAADEIERLIAALQSIADESYNDSAQLKARRALSASGDSK